jgi:hypothetical protein
MPRSEIYQGVSRRILRVEAQVQSQAIEKGCVWAEWFYTFSLNSHSTGIPCSYIYYPWAIGRSSDTY